MSRLETSVNTFDKYASEYQDKYMGYKPYVETYRTLSELITADGKVLDVACGPGNISKFLLDTKPQLKVHGIDLSPKMIELARRNNPGAEFEVKDSRDIGELNNQYDAIVCGFCIPYLSEEEVRNFIADARDRIMADGILYLSTMEGDHEGSGYQSNDSEDRVYIYYYQAEFLLTLLESNGFDILDIERKPFEQDGAPQVTDLFIFAKARG